MGLRTISVVSSASIVYKTERTEILSRETVSDMKTSSS